VFLRRRDHGIGDLVERLVPADAPPLTAAALSDAFERVAQPLWRNHQVAVAGALLATAREEVGCTAAPALLERLRLLLAPHDAVLDVDVPRAGGQAVGAVVRAAHDAIPRPLLAEHVFPTAVFPDPVGGAVLGLLCQQRRHLQAGEEQRRRTSGRRLQELPSV
jgi:hypothetical protein